MRAGMKPEWLVVGDTMIGISLGADYCAEHEWGIGQLKHTLGIDGAKARYSRERVQYTKPHGLPRRTITRHEAVKMFEHDNKAALVCYDSYWFGRFEEYASKHGIAKAMKESLPSELRPGRELSAAWDEGSFGIYGEGVNAARIKELAKAFESNNIAIWIGGTAIPVFENGGLVVAIADRIPAENVEMLRDSDVKAEELQKASDATGIIKRLEAAKRTFFACSPRWLSKEFKPQGKDKKSAHPVIYWLNPTEQDENNYGYFTVEELDQWIAGTGPIPMKKGQKA